MRSHVALGDLGSPEIDLHVGVRATGTGVHAEPLFEERNVLVERARGPAARRSRRALGELRHVRVELLPGRGYRDQVAAAYARDGIRREVVMTVPSFVAATAIVAASELVATVPASLIASHGARLGVREVRGPIPVHAVAMAMCWHERTHADPAASALRDVVRGALT